MRQIAQPTPPKGISVDRAPLFVTMGFDDNGHSGLIDGRAPEGVTWASNFFASLKNPQGNNSSKTFDGVSGSCSFYFTSNYINDNEDEPNELVRKSWYLAMSAGHEVGCHTRHHYEGGEFTVDKWREEIEGCISDLARPYSEEIGDFGIGVDPQNIVAFRTPFLDYNDNTFRAISELNFLYDCSIEEGVQDNQNGENFLWPYTLDEGSPGNRFTHKQGETPFIGNYPLLWEVPSYVLITPPDEKCNEYGIEPGFRSRLKELQPTYFNESDGKITGLDYNCLVEFEMNREEWLATLKYTFDLRVKGNRAPFPFGGHSDVYATGYDICPNISIEERREVIEEFFNYVLTFDFVRVVSVEKMLEWLQNPVEL